MHQIELVLPLGWGLLLSGFLILLNGFFVAAEFSMVKVRKTRLTELTNQGHLRAKLTQKITQHLDEYLSATQLGITLASIALGWIGEPAFAELVAPFFARFGEIATLSAHTVSLTTAFIIITVLHVVVGELIPKSVAIQQAERISLWIAYPLWIFDKIFYPFLGGLNKVTNTILKLVGLSELKEKAPTEEELRIILAEWSKQGIVSPTELTIIRRALTFSDKMARDILIPQYKVDTLHQNDPFIAMHEKAAQSLHSRLPIRGEQGKVVGFVRIQDLLLQTEQNFSIKAILKPILEFPEVIKIDQAFQTMKDRKIFIAAVYNKRNEWLGIITITDIIEELMGQVD